MRAMAALLLVALLAQSPPEPLEGPLRLEQVTRLALERNPALRAASLRVDSLRRQADADALLPAPELMAEAWQVPFAKPWSLYDAQMLSLSLKQTFPSFGANTARAESRQRAADAEAARRSLLELELGREVGHAFVDLQEATARHAIRTRHEAIAGRIVAAAQARASSGGKLEETLFGERDRARLQADVVAEGAGVTRAKYRLNALLGRPADAKLGAPEPTPVQTLAAGAVDRLLAGAVARRPEQAEVAARRASESAALTAMRREATVPGVSVALGYYAPTALMPAHGFGLSLGVELPWLWGGRRAAADAQALQLQAVEADASAIEYRVGVDVVTAVATARAAADRWRSLHDVALPAAQRAFEGAFASYRSGSGDALDLLGAERAVVELEVELVAARAMLDHALIDLDASLAQKAPREVLEAAKPEE